MIACSGMALVLASGQPQCCHFGTWMGNITHRPIRQKYKAEISGSHNDPRPQANTKAIPLQATNNLFINCLLDVTLIPRFNQVITGFTRPLWILLGQYGSAIIALLHMS